MKKRIISILLAVTMLSATLAGCAGNSADSGEKTTGNKKGTQETTAAGADSEKETGEEHHHELLR